MEINIHQTQDILDHMGYVFVSCISGRRSGANEISLVNTGAITALPAGIEFNFSKFIMHELDGPKSTHEDDDGDLYGDVEFLKEIDFTGFSDDVQTNTELDLNDEEFGPLPGFLNNYLNIVNEVASLATKTREEGNALKILLSMSNPMEDASSQGDVMSEIPTSVSTISTSAPIIPDSA
ncbi:unnamed protein product [Lactuca saligna]|uniref:Uncharacterized protein n=1 Tax=Lactuca saligna TaxID=75948 RepID=A0AA35Z0H9_LACSI|nr:unnamed protein product [Lactuca saligna]